MKRKKILIIEDEKALQESLSEYLITENFQVFSASDGLEGVSLADSKSPDLIVLDIVLPKMDGFKVVDEIKGKDSTKNIPIIILTNLENSEDIQKAFDKGITSYLVKSDYKLEDIVKKIKEILGD